MSQTEKFDLVVVGGGIAGSVAARLAAQHGFNTLLIEKYKTPRPKACSGIQFGYFEKLLGLKIPESVLCTNQISRIRIEIPSGKGFTVPYPALNFERDVFDHWLNQEAMNVGVTFWDETSWKNHTFDSETNQYHIQIHQKEQEKEVICRYLFAADGLISNIRRKQLHLEKPPKSTGAALNYYIKPSNSTHKLKDNKLYMFWNLDFCNMMFAWVYKKNDLWVVGTGYTDSVKSHCKSFLNYIKEKFQLDGEIVKTEAYSTNMNLTEPAHIYLGEQNLLMLGDAAGLVDLSRGVGMDNAALSARCAVDSILSGKESSDPYFANKRYSELLKPLIKKIDAGTTFQVANLKSNKELIGLLKNRAIKAGLGMYFGAFLNKFRKPENVILLPPS